MIRLEIKKIQYDVNRKATKISTLSSGKIDKYLTVEEILPSDQSRTYFFSFRKSYRKINKNDWRTNRKTNKNN